MALRRQLLLLASLTLALPWAGCEYVKEMEATLRQGQEAALTATAQAVAARLVSDDQLAERLNKSVESLNQYGSEDAFYAHLLGNSVVLDGYNEEWRGMGIRFQKMTVDGRGPSFSVSWGERDGMLYGFIQVADEDRQFFDPSLPHAASDHLLLLLGDGMALRFFSAAPGVLSVERHIGEGVWQREHRAVGVWNELLSSYSLEIRLPMSWALDGLAVVPHDGASDEGAKTEALRALVRHEVIYDESLAVFARPGVRLSLVTDEGWLLGRAGQLHFRSDSPDRDNFIQRVFRRVLGQPDFPALPAEIEGRLSGELPNGQFEGVWYLVSDSLLGRVILRVGSSPEFPVWLVAEQTMDSLEKMTTGAMGRLLWYTAIVMALVGLTLLAYASILSLRIRRLSRAAQRAVDSEGRIRSGLPGSRSRDEIGDLSRSFSALLQRLREYNEYLESLAGKLSHELRTPLAIVRSSLDNLAETENSSEQRVYIQRAGEGAARLSKLLNAMSAAARLEQSMQNSELERVDLADLLGHLVESYRSVYTPRSLSLTCSGGGLVQANVAPDSIAQMCDKLVENAADFTGENGAIELVLNRHQHEVILQVINLGPPLPDALQDRLFDSLTSTRSGDGEHLGLGLYVVKMIARFHKGRVRAFNHPDGQRVVFEIVLPAAE